VPEAKDCAGFLISTEVIAAVFAHLLAKASVPPPATLLRDKTVLC
jgi:hypothetical protein